MLLIAPTLSFALYSRLLLVTHRQKEAVERKLTRDIVGLHAFRALGQVYILQKHLDTSAEGRAARGKIEDSRDQLESEVES